MANFDIDDALKAQTEEEYIRISNEVGQFPSVLQTALAVYMEDANLSYNQILRSLQEGIKNLSEINPTIKHIYDAFRTVSPTKKDMIVYRGYTPPENDPSFPGYHTFDKGFVSTSIDYEISTFFRNEDCCTSIILIPAGSKVLCLGKIKSSLLKDEMEVLLPFNAKFELLDTYSKGVYFLKYVQSPLTNMSSGEICNIILESEFLDTENFSYTLDHLFDKCGRLTRFERQSVINGLEEQLIKTLAQSVYIFMENRNSYDVSPFVNVKLFLEKFSLLVNKKDMYLYIFEQLNEVLSKYYHSRLTSGFVWEIAGNFYLETSDVSIIKALLESNAYGKQNTLVFRAKLPENYIEYLELVYTYSNKDLLIGLWNIVLQNYKDYLPDKMSKTMAEAIISFLIQYDIPVGMSPVNIIENIKVFKNFLRIPGVHKQLPEILPSVWRYAVRNFISIDNDVKKLIENNIPFIASDEVKAILEERMQYVCSSCEMYKKLLS